MERIWILGANGKIGNALTKILDATDNEILCTDKNEVDVTDEERIETYALMNRPNIIINCAGKTEMDECDENPDEAYLVNTIGTRNLAVQAQKLNAKLVQISTDDVFNGDNAGNFNEFDMTCPNGIYGKSKRAGEKMIQTLMHKYYIIRSSWVYGIGDDYVDQVCKTLAKGEKVYASSTEMAVPTFAGDIADFIAKIIHTSDYGIYHITGKGSCSRYEYACEIAKLCGFSNELVQAVDTPNINTTLDNMMLRLNGFSELEDWKITLKKYIDNN